MMRWHLAAALLAVCPGITRADTLADQAFASGDYMTAQAIWEQEAETGDAQAMLGLGLLADRGYGQARDIGAAFAWYQRAADLGLAEAQFNVAVMLDAGLGRTRDPVAAQLWYTRAALRDHARAQYNLALLYESGDGIAANPALATYWFGQAADDVPAAADRTLAPAPAEGATVVPDILFSEVSDSRFEIVWSAAPAAASTYMIEAVAIPDQVAGYDAPLLASVTDGSGLLDPAFNAPDSDLIWRVVNLNADMSDYAASAWITATDVSVPEGRITLLYDPQSAAMTDATAYFAQTLRDAGFWVSTRERDRAAAVYVGYSYASDAAFAQTVAAFLPTTDAPAQVERLEEFSQPGEIIIDLAAFRSPGD